MIKKFFKLNKNYDNNVEVETFSVRFSFAKRGKHYLFRFILICFHCGFRFFRITFQNWFAEILGEIAQN